MALSGTALGPSHSARSGSGWVSMNTPATPPVEAEPGFRSISVPIRRYDGAVVAATSAEAALCSLGGGTRRPDLVIADYHLGDGNGITAIGLDF